MNRDNSPESSTGHGGESAEELLRGVHARLLAHDSLSPEVIGSLRYARLVADGLVFAYALDGPAGVRVLTDRDVERVGLDQLGQAARANLMRAPVTYEDVPVEGRATLHSVFGDSHFVASKALYLGELARQVTGESLPHAGALVVVPTRHLLAYHPIADGSVVDALNDLASYALGAYEDGPGPLSPRVYWWHRGALTSLTVVDEDTRTLSLRPPQHLLGLMKGLVRLDRSGRITTPGTEQAPEADGLATATAESIARLAHEPSGLGDAFASALALAHVRCAADPHASDVVTWDAWESSVRLGSALFTGAEPQQCYLGEQGAVQLPATPADPPADARAWLDALYVALVCRAHDRVARLCRVPLETLRQDDTVDAYVLHWIDTLQTYLSAGGSADAVVEKLLATMQSSLPETLTHSPDEFVNRVDFQPVSLFHRLFTRDHDAFGEALADALAEHGGYWEGSAAPRAQVALGPLAMACLAHDQGFPLGPELPHLPTYLVDGKRIEHIS
ncbi:immunity 49 family protein [Streptomyces virginiae]|uniref:immunity 49 family protein n=1 Tax=Streptomyces virginiae TaxID=1961 RepID=UPI00225224AB|nr:immunity 49 family protein [Streptomyces virginiae]MCX4957245.1 immunity 49 family protein [Streptomyces virginiae]